MPDTLRADTGHRPRPAWSAAAPRLRQLGWSAVLLALTVPALVLFSTTLTGLPLMVVGVGVPLVLGGVFLTRRLADLHRRIFGRALGVEIARPYRPWPGEVAWTIRSASGAGRVWRQLVAVIGDPATWRDLAWLLLDVTVGLAAYALVIALFGAIWWYAALPLLWLVVSETAGTAVAAEVLRTDLGFFAVDSQATSFAGPPMAVVALALWWWVGPLVLRGYARLSRTLLGPGSAALAARVSELTESRAETVQAGAAELRRIERDLHDGAQARLVALGMSLGMAEELIRTDPEAAARLVAEARETSGQALAELRNLVRGVHPPVLADRGLSAAVQALALAHPLPVEVVDELPGRPPRPVESAVYFAVAETLTNVTKRASASSAAVRLGYGRGRLRVTVTDDGRGGAEQVAGGGLHGVSRRLAAFDGTVRLSSPPGGPTVVDMEVPCELS
jgi:signal transduction histidine kinase